MPPLEVRPLQTDDLPALMAVQRAAYGDGFMESTEVFARRLASPVNCSLALLLDGALCAYLAAYQSVQGSEGYWQRHGYVAQPLHQPEQQQRLASYGEGAVYMARTLQAI